MRALAIVAALVSLAPALADVARTNQLDGDHSLGHQSDNGYADDGSEVEEQVIQESDGEYQSAGGGGGNGGADDQHQERRRDKPLDQDIDRTAQGRPKIG